MTATPEQIVAGLTKAQREAVLDASDMMSSHGGYPFLTVRHTGEPWPQHVAQFLTLTTDRLTETGLAVRAYLMEKGDD